MKVTVFEVEPWEKDSLADLARHGHTIAETRDPLTGFNARAFADTEVAVVFIYSRIDGRVLAALPRLKLIATRSTGIDHIDTDACVARGVVVANVPVYGEATVAEHVFALLLAISHRLIESVDRTRRGDFSSEGLQGFDLAGKTIGIVGTGNIGRHVVAIAKGFGMKVIATDIKPDHDMAVAMGFRYVDFDTVLAEADVLTLHVPGVGRPLIGVRELSLMKDGAVLVNTARGGVVDVRALAMALASGKLAAAGLDVLAEEPAIREEAELLRSLSERGRDLSTLLADHILLRLRNVIVTPHNAFNTREAVSRIAAVTRDNILAFAGGAPANVVAGP